MTDFEGLHIDIDLHRAGAVPQGTVSTADGSAAPFEGWLSFLAALERAMGLEAATPQDRSSDRLPSGR
jgi:hypothetical protein